MQHFLNLFLNFLKFALKGFFYRIDSVGFMGDDPFFVFRMAESPGLNGNGYLYQEGEDQEACCPDPKGDHELHQVGDININLAERVGDESGDDETRAFLDPDPYDDEDTSQVQGA